MRKNRSRLQVVVEPDFPDTVTTPRASGMESDALTVESVYNHLYFYSDVDSDRGLALMRALREIDNMLQNERGQRSIPADHPQTPIWLHIQSGGGSVFSGLALADQLQQIRTPIYSIVEGFCASAATLISMSCTRRYIQPSAFMLIHQLSAINWGTYEQLQDTMNLNTMLMESLVKFYVAHTNLDETAVREFMRRDSWFDSKACLANGLVDEIMR